MVWDQYEVYNEEHPGVANRNFKRVGLVGTKPLSYWGVSSNICTLWAGFEFISN